MFLFPSSKPRIPIVTKWSRHWTAEGLRKSGWAHWCPLPTLEGEDELKAVTKERDALRVALRKVLAPYDVLGNFGGEEWGHVRENVKQARQLAYPNTSNFLTTPESEWT